MEKQPKVLYNEDNKSRELCTMNLFQKSIEPHCAYCALGKALSEDQIACPKKGVMSPGSSCRAFKYDPLKRVPPRPTNPAGVGLSDEDFSL